jgi:mono/diheme cytochrome c family protein
LFLSATAWVVVILVHRRDIVVGLSQRRAPIAVSIYLHPVAEVATPDRQPTIGLSRSASRCSSCHCPAGGVVIPTRKAETRASVAVGQAAGLRQGAELTAAGIRLGTSTVPRAKA